MEKNLLEKIWLGLLPLPVLYWGFAVCGGVVWRVLFNFVDDNNAVAVNCFLFIALAYQFFITVGIWRAANNYKKSIVLAWLAKIATTIGTVILLITFLGFSKLKTIQNETVTQSPSEQVTITSDNKKTMEGKLGATYKWVKLDSVEGNWWISKAMRNEKYNTADIFLKTESLKDFKNFGSFYNYTVYFVNFSCSDQTYFVRTTTVVFTEEYMKDTESHFLPQYDGGYKKVESKDKKIVAAYNYACGKN